MAEFRCLLCRDAKGRVTMRSPGVAPRELWRCASCGFVQLHPAPDLAECLETYEGADHYAIETLTMEDAVLDRDRSLIAELEGLGAHGPLLDVGPGAGTLVRAARERGWEVSAVELARPSAEALRRDQGIEVHERPLEELDPPASKVGVVVFSHSLEHVADPVATLEAARRWLGHDGIVHVAVPHWSSWKRRLAGPHTPWIFPGHVSYFDARQLRDAARRAGLEPFAVDTRPFQGVDYRFAIAVLRRVRVEGLLARFLKLDDPRLDGLLADDLQLACPPWRFRAVFALVRALLAASDDRLACRFGRGEELRLSARPA